MNIYNQNVAFNYRGILNLDATTINTPLDATLRAVTDGMGTSSVLNLSTTQVNIGGGTALGRLVVKGDGTNPIARFENTAGTIGLIINANNTIHFGDVTNTNGVNKLIYTPNIGGIPSLSFSGFTAGAIIGHGNQAYFNISVDFSQTAGRLLFGSFFTSALIATTGTYRPFVFGGNATNEGVFKILPSGTGSANYRILSTEYTIDATAGVQTGNATGLFLNATETALNGMTHNLMDLQVGGVSRLKLTNAGAITVSSTINSAGNITSGDSVLMANTGQLGWGVRSIITCSSDGNLTLKNSSGTSFSLLQLGGTTSSFPSIKRNGATIDFRLADDSNYCGVTLLNLVATDFIRARLVSVSGIQLLESTSGNDFNRLQFGGTTSAFPSIKRNGAQIDFRLADDSGFCAISSGSLNVNGNSITLVGSIGNTSAMRIDAAATTGLLRLTTNSVNIGGNTTNNASALLQADSTTQGFLMPRQTQAQILAIVTPANGLQVYNTDLAQPCFYDGTGWKKINHSPM